MDALLVFVGLILAIAAFSWIVDKARKAGLYERLKPRLDALDANEARLDNEQEEWAKKLTADKKALETLAREKSAGFPWLGQAYADYFHLEDLKTARHLEIKSHPAKKAAEQVREMAGKRRTAERLWRILKYQLEYYEQLFPWLVDFKGEDLDDLIRQVLERASTETDQAEDIVDPVSHWLTGAEYATLSPTERNQLALNRYWQKKKSPWELGRDYERFAGYEYESAGWRVHYQGIIEGLSDLGRDLLASRENRVEIIQCKYWSREKIIHEKHVFQLYGTVVAYRIDHPSQSNVSATFITSTALSERAKQFANALDVRCLEGHGLQKYPSIKCNISQRDGSRIYHLPLDQQYDRTVVHQERLERYVETVAEAEALGFRRAFRWTGEHQA